MLFHEVGKNAGVGGKTGEGDTEVRVDWNDLLLVGRKLFCVALQCLSESTCDLMSERGSRGAKRTLTAASTACVLLTMPTTTEPCFTASDAYSTWKIRPCGEKVTESLS